MVGGGGLASAPAGPGQVILGGLPITFAAAATPMQTALHHQRQPSKDRLDTEDSAAEQAQGWPLWFTVLGCRCAAADHWPSGRGRLLGGVGADTGFGCQGFDGRYPLPGGPRGCVLGATAQGTVPTGSGQEQCGDPECHPANPAPGPQALGCGLASAAAVDHLCCQEDLSRPLRRCHPKPGARANAPIVSKQEIPD